MSVHTPIKDSEIIDGLNIWYLKLFGLWKVINDYRTTGKKNSIINLQLTITLAYSIPYILCQLMSCYFIKMDLKKITFIFLLTLSKIQICIKVLVVWFFLRIQCRLSNLMKKDFIDLPEHKKSEAKQIFKKIAFQTNLLSVAAFIINTSYYIVSIGFPDTPVDYILHHTGNTFRATTGRMKIVGGWYPIPFDKTPYFEIIFFYEASMMMWVGTFLAVYVSLFYQTLMCLYAQFAVLGIKLTTLDSGDGKEKIWKSDSERYNELLAIIKYHQKLLRYADELRLVYNPLVTMILGTGVFVLILAAFQFLFGTTTSTIFIVKSLIFLPYQAIEVCMFCFASSYLETASSDVLFAIYNSDWYKADIKFRKSAQMMMIRAKKGETLKSVSIYPINVETMMSIFQFTYTVSALMLKTTE
ncbi:odorant receptor 10-like [Halyomorpha halys]|uniref:odorant receptor 10-like n=1 Tax=Halyomorpha halys TaxID=286706 RepID=UPI0006D4E513|nr:Odorant receptor 66 [Halyomorpha halys]